MLPKNSSRAGSVTGGLLAGAEKRLQSPPNCAFRYRHRPRLGEFDLGGVLYHANYFHVYESARESLLEEIGCPYPKMVNEGSHLVVVESAQSFLRPVFYGIILDVRVWLSDMKASTAVFNYAFFPENQTECLHRAATRHAFVGQSGGADGKSSFRPLRFSTGLKQGLSAYAVQT